MGLGFMGSKLVYQVLFSSLLKSAVSMFYLVAGNAYVPFMEIISTFSFSLSSPTGKFLSTAVS